MNVFSPAACRRRASGAVSAALAMGLLVLTASPAAVAKNDDDKCKGNCEAEPAPAPVLGGSLAGMIVLVAGVAVLHRGRRQG